MSKRSFLACALGLLSAILAMKGADDAQPRTPEVVAAWILYRADCRQAWYELPDVPSIQTKGRDTVPIHLVDTSSWLGRLQSRLLGVGADNTVLTGKSGEILHVTDLLSPAEIASLIEHLDENRRYLPDLREAVHADPDNLEVRWDSYFDETEAGNEGEASKLLADLKRLDPDFASPFAERYRISQCLATAVLVSDTPALERILECLGELVSSTRTSAGLRKLSMPLATLHVTVGEPKLAGEWLRVRWETRLPWEKQTVARRLLDTVGDDIDCFEVDLLRELRECADLTERASSD